MGRKHDLTNLNDFCLSVLLFDEQLLNCVHSSYDELWESTGTLEQSIDFFIDLRSISFPRWYDEVIWWHLYMKATQTGFGCLKHLLPLKGIRGFGISYQVLIKICHVVFLRVLCVVGLHLYSCHLKHAKKKLISVNIHIVMQAEQPQKCGKRSRWVWFISNKEMGSGTLLLIERDLKVTELLQWVQKTGRHTWE